MPNNPARRRVGFVKAASFGKASKAYVGAQVAVTEQRILQQQQNSSPTTVEQQSMPAGLVMYWPALLSNVPTGWLLCDGAVVNIDDYPALFQALGTVYGGDGVTTFGLPDSVDRFIRSPAAATDPGATGGSTQHKHAAGTLAAAAASAGAITLTKTTAAVQSGVGTTVVTDVTAAQGTHTHTLSGATADAEDAAASTTPEDIYPPFIEFAAIIKT